MLFSVVDGGYLLLIFAGGLCDINNAVGITYTVPSRIYR